MVQYQLYLFEALLICCKEESQKARDRSFRKLFGRSRDEDAQQQQQQPPKLKLKGRIFMHSVTDLISLAKPGKFRHPLLYLKEPH